MKISVRFFSGTGNTWRIALACQDALRQAGHVTDLQSILDHSAPVTDAEAVCFCFPVYALDIPRIASAYLRNLPQRSKPVPSIVIVTGGSPDNCGWAVDTAVRLLAERGYPVQIGELIQMPNNWIPFDSPPPPDEADRMIESGIRKAMEITRRFLAGEAWIKPISLKRFGVVGSVLMRTIFHRRGVYKLWILYRVTDSCQGCGLCERICPTHSIKLVDGKPVWSVGCEQCMRCVNYCPKRAIQQLEGLLHGSRHRAHHLAGFKPNENVSRE